MIQITGLSKRQKVLADILWTFNEWEQVERFMNTLPKRDRIDCEGIVELMRLALIEECVKEGYVEESNTEANELINRIKNKL